MRVKLEVRVRLVDVDPEYRGITTAAFEIGRVDEITFAQAMAAVIDSVADFYGAAYTAEELNGQMAAFRRWFEACGWHEEPTEGSLAA